jgi:hypothetical protein
MRFTFRKAIQQGDHDRPADVRMRAADGGDIYSIGFTND